jgi:hypothetical protein
MQVRVIDDSGKVWDAACQAFREEFHLAWIDGDMSPQLVDNLGFIRLLLRGGTTRVIDFNPGSVARPAIAGLNRWLRSQKRACEQVSLAFGPAFAERKYRICPSAIAALRDLEALVEEVRGPEPPFTALSGSLHEVQSIPAFAPLFAHWRVNGGVFSEADFGPLLRYAHDRFIIFAPRSGDGALKIVHAGSGLRIPDKRSHAALNGARLSDVADQAFGQWTSGIYRSVLERQMPRFDHIHALIRWPSVGRVERKYSRLILPCRTKEGQRLLLGVSGELGAPDLDVEVA